MNYEILTFDPNSGSAVVKFFTNEFTDGLVYNIDIPVENGSFIKGDQLTGFIMSFAPYGQIQRILDVRKAEVPAELASFIPAEPK